MLLIKTESRHLQTV